MKCPLSRTPEKCSSCSLCQGCKHTILEMCKENSWETSTHRLWISSVERVSTNSRRVQPYGLQRRTCFSSLHEHLCQQSTRITLDQTTAEEALDEDSSTSYKTFGTTDISKTQHENDLHQQSRPFHQMHISRAHGQGTSISCQHFTAPEGGTKTICVCQLFSPTSEQSCPRLKRWHPQCIRAQKIELRGNNGFRICKNSIRYPRRREQPFLL